MTGEELTQFAQMVSRGFAAKRMPRELMEDVEQNVALVMLETERRYGLPLKGNRAYYFRPATCVPAMKLAQDRACVHLTEHALRHEEVAHFFGYVEMGAAQELDCGRQADAAVREEEAARARLRLWDFLEDHIAAMDEVERKALRMLLGIGTPQRDPEEVAEAIGRKPAFVWGLARRLGRSVKKDRGARRARRVMLQHREDLAA